MSDNHFTMMDIRKIYDRAILRWLFVLAFAIHSSACGSHDSLSKPAVEHSLNKQVKSAEENEFQVPYKARKKLKYPQYEVLTKYHSEQEVGVKYYSPAERDRLKVIFKDGLLHNAEGEKLDPELDLPKHSGRSGKAIFVISMDGIFWVCFDQRYGLIHHSSLLAGAPVLSAGEMVLADGQLLSISNASGHYKPPAKSLDVAIHLLKEHKVDLSQLERYEISPAGTTIKKSQDRSLPAILEKLPIQKNE